MMSYTSGVLAYLNELSKVKSERKRKKKQTNKQTDRHRDKQRQRQRDPMKLKAGDIQEEAVEVGELNIYFIHV